MLVSKLIQFLDDNNFKKVGVFVVEQRLRTLLSDFSFDRVKEMNSLIILQYKEPTDKETYA